MPRRETVSANSAKSRGFLTKLLAPLSIAAQPIALLVRRGEQDDGQQAVSAGRRAALQHFKPADAGEVDVEKDHGGRSTPSRPANSPSRKEVVEGLLAVPNDVDTVGKVDLLQGTQRQHLVLMIVLHQQDRPGRHDSSVFGHRRGQAEAEDGPSSRSRCGADRAAVSTDDALDRCQPDPDPRELILAMKALKGLEQAWPRASCRTPRRCQSRRTRFLHRCFAAEPDGRLGCARRVLPGVPKKVAQDYLHQFGVAAGGQAGLDCPGHPTVRASPSQGRT